MKNKNFQVDEKTHRQLNRLAKRDKRTLKAVVRILVEKEMAAAEVAESPQQSAQPEPAGSPN